MTERDFNSFYQEYEKYKTSSDVDKDKKLDDLYDRHEKGLTYIGSTAIEDKL